MPALAMMSFHFATSAAMNFPSSSGEVAIGSAPKSVKRARTVPSDIAFATSAAMRSMADLGVPRGAARPTHAEKT